MKRKLAIIIVGLATILCLAACTEQPVETLPLQSAEPSLGSPTETIESTLQNPWKEISENVFDISNLTENLQSLTVFNVSFEHRVFVCLDDDSNRIHFIPFELDKLSVDTNEDYMVTAPWTSEYSIRQNMLLIRESSWVGERSVHTHNLSLKQMFTQWELPYTSIVGMSKNADEVLLVDTLENSQRIYVKNVVDGNDQEIFMWDTSDKTKTPTITMISQGNMGFAFTGWIYPSPNAQSVTCYGFIDNEGNLTDLKIQDPFDVEFFSGGMVIYDAIPVYGSNPNQIGQYLVYSADTLSTVNITPETTDESATRRICVSETGKYILTGSSLTEDGCFRVYETQTGNAIAKFDSAVAIEGPVQQISSISEKDKAFIIVALTETGSQVYYYQF